MQPTSQPAAPQAGEPARTLSVETEFLRLFGSRLGGAFVEQRAAVQRDKEPRQDLPEAPADTKNNPVTPPAVEVHAIAAGELKQAAGHARSHELSANARQKPVAAPPDRRSASQPSQAPHPQAQPGEPTNTDGQPAPQRAEAAQTGAHTARQAAQALPDQAAPAATAARAQGGIQAVLNSSSASATSGGAAPIAAARGAAQPNAIAGPGKPQRGVFHAKAAAKTPTPQGNARPAKENFEAQLARGMAAVLKQKGGSVTLKLSPNELGSMKIQMSLDPNGMEARFEAGSEKARSLLEQNLSSLRSALEAKGMAVERLRVEPPAQQASQNDASGQNTDADSERERPDGSGRDGQGGPWERDTSGQPRGGAPGDTGRSATDGAGGPAEGGAVGGSEGADDQRVGDPFAYGQRGDGDGVRLLLSVDTVA